MAGISFSGLASGLDTDSIISALVDVAGAPVDRLKTKKSNYNIQKSKISSLSTALSTLQTAAKKMDTVTEFKAYTASVSTADAAYIGATAGTSATPGTYKLEIVALAAAERTYSDALSSKTTTGLVGSGTLSITIGTSAAVNISVDDTTDTLEGVASKINSSAAAVSAGVMYDGTNYRLVITGNKTGADSAIAFSEGGTLALGLDKIANQAQEAQDAEIMIDGISVSNGTNKITTAIPGVTLDLLKVTGTSSVTVKVAEDLDTVVTNITELVDAYNNIAKFLKSEFTYTKGMNAQASLMGDVSVRNVQTKLKRIMSGAVSTADEPYTALSRVGITSNKDGTMTVSSTKLKAALAEDLEGVTKLFTVTDSDDSTTNDGVMVTLVRDITQFVQSPGGLLAARQKGIDQSIKQIDSRISTLERSISSYEKGLKRQFAALENLLSDLQSTGAFLTANYAKKST